MVPVEPRQTETIGHDALKVWMDFWELTGRLRVDIIRRSASDGDPAKLIPPDVSEVKIRAVPAIVVGREKGAVTDRSGEIPVDQVKMEFIDRVHGADFIGMGGVEYEVDSVQEREMGGFSIWLVRVHRVG